MSEYTDKFIDCCKNLKNEIQQTSSQSGSLPRCLHVLNICVTQLQNDKESHSPSPKDWFEPLWFIYYMFFAIHNPKLEEYINRKYESTNISSSTSTKEKQRHILTPKIAASHVLKNMIRRRESTSTIVYQLFEYANIKNGKATYVYPFQHSTQKRHQSIASSQTSQNDPARHVANTIIKSFRAGHLKTTAVNICKLQKSIRPDDIDIVYRLYIDSILENQQSAIYTNKVDEICEKRYKIQYNRKDIIFLALVTYMHVNEEDINIRAVFISLTDEEAALVNDVNDEVIVEEIKKCQDMPQSPNDIKYKCLLS
jgi:hypothetical protein